MRCPTIQQLVEKEYEAFDKAQRKDQTGPEWDETDTAWNKLFDRLMELGFNKRDLIPHKNDEEEE